jgi:4-hydroxybenzoate polyprenyltransferase
MMPESSAGTDASRTGAAKPLIWSTLAALIRLPNQSGTWLLMLPTLWALVLASHGRPPASLLLIFAAGSFLMRSAGVILNDLADRSFDRQVTRTRSRPLASGALGVPVALATAAVLVSLAAMLLAFLNTFTLLLSPVALLLAALYPFAKRLVHIPQAVLGIAFGWGVVMAWAAVRDALDVPVWFLYVATICWALAYDTIYALQDRDDDTRIGVKSATILFGERAWLAVGIALAGMLTLLALAGWLMGLGTVFYGTLAVVGGFFSQQVLALRRSVSSAQAFALFKQHIWAGVTILAGIWAGFL